MKKKLLIALAAVVVVIVIALVAVVVSIDAIAKGGIERGASYATGVTTTLGSADVGITSGQLEMKELNIANPDGYTADHFLDLERGFVHVGLGSLMEEQIEVPAIEFKGLDMQIERADGKNNYDVILANLKKLSSGEKKTEPKEGGKTYVIRKLTIEGTSVTITGFGSSAQTLELPTIELTDIGSGGDAKQMSEVVGIVIRELMQSLLSDPTKLPGVLVGSLGEGLQGLGALGDVDVEAIGQIGEGVGQTIGELGEKANQISPEAGKAVEEVGTKVEEGLSGLGNMFGGDKKKKDEPKEDAEQKE